MTSPDPGSQLHVSVFRCRFRVDAGRVIADDHHAGARRVLLMEIFIAVLAVAGGLFLFRHLRARTAH
jgi:hypothetical protein